MGGTRVRGSVGSFAFAAMLAASCGSGSSDEGFALQARGGTYVDGSGRLGLAVLTTIRNADGGGPALEWSGSLTGPVGLVGGTVVYSHPGAGSWFAAWWPEEPGYAGSYSLELSPAGAGGLETGFEIGAGTGIAPPVPSPSEDGSSISWGAAAGAAAYECRVYDDAGLVLQWLGSGTACDLSALPAGAYAASILAYSTDLATIAATTTQRPALPARFDVAEARLAFSRIDGAVPAAVLAVAGGGFHDGTSWAGRGLAVWISILNSDGTPTAVPWSVKVVGPGLPATAPMTFTYPARFSRIMVWSSAVPASPGTWGLIARSSEGSLGRAFTLGALPAIDAPTAIGASAGSQGSASVQWTAVPGAASYLVTARHQASHDFVMSQWVAGTSAAFPDGTFLADETYEVVVAATDADMVLGIEPSSFAITENSYMPASFVGR